MNPSSKVFLMVVVTACLLAAPILGQNTGKDNLGKEFYLAFGPNQGTDEDENLFALYLTSPVPASGYVEVPALRYRRSFTTTPGQIFTIDLPSARNGIGQSVEVRTTETVVPGMAVHVVADTDIAVYGMSHKLYSSDAFMAIPIDVLGTEYRTMCFPTSGVWGGGDTPGEFWVVATYDSTNVYITPADATSAGSPARQQKQVLLNRGDVYLIMGDYILGNDLTGSLIEADLPIAVFSGHERTEMPIGAKHHNPLNPTQFLQSFSRDHLVEQLPPVSAWGDSALVIPFATVQSPDVVRIVSSEDANTVTINGTTTVTIDAGEFYQITQLVQPTSIIAQKPILVGQYSHSSHFGYIPDQQNPGKIDPLHPPYADPALALVYPVEQFARSYTFISVVDAKAFTANYVNVVAEQSAIATMQLDGQPIPVSNFRPIPGSGYVYGQIALSQGTHNITGAKPFGITVYGFGPFDSYTYTGGTLLKTITPFKTVDLVIDFGDRVLDDTLGGSWDTTVFLQNISSDPLTIHGFMRRTGDHTKFWVIDSNQRDMQPGERGSMTIHFEPREADRRMHTIIQAKTDHLRAYVVDVYGRGVLARPGTYADTLAAILIDTLDFGIHGESSPPLDSIAYIVNRGSADLLVDSVAISGPNAADFSFLGASISSTTAPLPFLVPKASTQAAGLGIRFTPSVPRSQRVAYLDYSSPTMQRRRLVLIARVDTIELASVTPASFDSILICESDDGTITITNPNTFTVRLEGLTITGRDATDFSLLTQLPLDILPGSSVTVRVRFAPNTPGLKIASVTASFDIPTGAKRSFQLQGIGRKLEAAFRAPREIGILGNDEVLFPIYATSDLSRYRSRTYALEITYDPTYLEDVEAVIENTLMPYNYYMVEGDFPGWRRYTFSTWDNSYLTGGPNDTIPLVYIRFKALLTGEAIQKVYQEIEIDYKITFGESPLPVHCIASDPTPGRIIIDSACAAVHVVKMAGVPQEMFIDYPSPNPVSNGPVSLYLYLPQESRVRLSLVNMVGEHVSTILDEYKMAGRYRVSYDASHLAAGQYFVRYEAVGKTRIRKLGIVR